MKSKFLSFAAIAAVVSFSLSCGAKDIKTRISKDELPQSAKTFIDTHFSAIEISYIEKEVDGSKVEYEAVLSNGTEISFDGQGNWKDVEALPATGVPSSVVPAQITSAVQAQFPGLVIKKIDKDRNEWEVELANGTDIEFDTAFNVKKIER